MADFNEDAKRLASRAFLKASYKAKTEDARKAYYKMVSEALTNQEELDRPQLEEKFKKELQDATKWYEKLKRDELRWIKAGKNVDEEFRKKYYLAPKVEM